MTLRWRVRRPLIGRRAEHGVRVAGRASWPALVVLAAVAVAACSGQASSRPTGSAPAPSGSGEATLGPEATSWPTQVVDGAVALAAANASFAQMDTDVTNAVNSTDPRKILTVMTDALKFLKANRPFVTALQGYPETKDTGDKLAAAYDQMIGGAQTIVDGLTSGNGEAVQQGFNEFFAGDSAYAETTGPLGDISAQAILMKRHFNE